MMNEPNLRQIDLLRQAGMRPNIVACILNNGRLMFCRDRQHKVWFFPQGGIDNHELPKQALYREIEEELGIKVRDTLIESPIMFYMDKIMFRGSGIGSRELSTDTGEIKVMRGKFYMFYRINCNIEKINFKDTLFDSIVWLDKKNVNAAEKLVTDPNKKNQYKKVIDKLSKYLRD
jgi:hypothetical protein